MKLKGTITVPFIFLEGVIMGDFNKDTLILYNDTVITGHTSCANEVYGPEVSKENLKTWEAELEGQLL